MNRSLFIVCTLLIAVNSIRASDSIANSIDSKLSIAHEVEQKGNVKDHRVPQLEIGIRDLMECVWPNFKKGTKVFAGDLGDKKGTYIIGEGKLYFLDSAGLSSDQDGTLTAAIKIGEQFYHLRTNKASGPVLFDINFDYPSDANFVAKRLRAIIHIPSNSAKAFPSVSKALSKQMQSEITTGIVSRMKIIRDLNSEESKTRFSRDFRERTLYDEYKRLSYWGEPEEVLNRFKRCSQYFKPHNTELESQISSLKEILPEWNLYSRSGSAVTQMEKQLEKIHLESKKMLEELRIKYNATKY